MFAQGAGVALGDATLVVPDPWYVGQLEEISGSGFPAYETIDLVITFSDESTLEEGAISSSLGNLYPEAIRIDAEAAGGTATIKAYIDEVEVASTDFEVISDPTILVPDPVDAEDSSFMIEGWGFVPYDGEDVFMSIVQGEYRMMIGYDDPTTNGYIGDLYLNDEDDWFTNEAIFVASLEDGTIIASTIVDVVNGTGSEPVFVSEFEPDIAVTTPGTFREGDSFDVDLEDGVPDGSLYVQVIGDNEIVEYDFGSFTTDEYGEASLTLRMPLVLDQGIAQDGRTIRVFHGGYSEDFQVTLNEGVRFGLETDNLQEGDTVEAEIRNGVGESQVIFQIVHDDEMVVHEYGYMETDGSGYGEFELTIPAVLDPEYTVDNFTIRTIHAGLIIDKSVTIEDGLRMYLDAENVREGHTLDVAVYNGTPSTSVSIDWWLDTTFVQSQSGSFSTDGSGTGEFEITVPDVLQSMAESDFFTLKVTHDGNTFELGITVYQTQTPDPGNSQVTGLVNGNNSTSVALDSIVGLAQMYNLGMSIEDIYLLIDEDFEFDPAFPQVLGYVANSILVQKPLDEVTLGDLLDSLVYEDFDDLFALSISDDPRHGLKERTAKQLVVLVHGMGGTNSDSKAGMNTVYNMIVGHVANGHVLRVESGDLQYGTVAAYENAWDQIELAISSFGIESVIIAGHSWGGGMAYALAEDINDIYSGSVEISGLVYVDAVWPVSWSSVAGFPDDVSSILNIYQSENDALVDLADGVSILNPGLAGFDGTAYYGRYREFDVDGDGENTSHVDIDEDYASEVADFIVHVLDEWYWDDLLN